MMPPMQRDAYAPPRGVVLEEKQDPKELIEVSEDDESDSGSEGSVTSESDDDMNEAPITINQLEEADIKDIKIEPASNISMQEPQKINLDSDAGSLSDQSELSDLPSQENSAPSPVKSVESIPDYNKLNVKTLKQIAEDRGLQESLRLFERSLPTAGHCRALRSRSYQAPLLWEPSDDQPLGSRPQRADYGSRISARSRITQGL